MIAPGDKRRQVASRVYKREEEVKSREGAVRVIAPGDKRRQVTSGVYTRREEVIREEKGQ